MFLNMRNTAKEEAQRSMSHSRKRNKKSKLGD